MLDPSVTIVIVNYETSDYVRRCVASLAEQDYPHEVIVVDNPSSAEDWRSIPKEGVRLLRNSRNLGYGLACNTGAAAAAPESGFICILNPDTVLPPGQLRDWVTSFDQYCAPLGGGLLAPALINENGSRQKSDYHFPSFISYWTHSSILAGLLKAALKKFGKERKQRQINVRQVDWVMGAALLIDKDTWRAVDGFCDRYFMYAEDTDLCYRIHQVGLPVIQDSSVEVIHTQGEPAPEVRHIGLVRLFRGLKIFIHTHYGFVRRSLVKLAVLLDMAIRLPMLSAAFLLKRRLIDRNRVRGCLEVIRLYLGSDLRPDRGK